MKIRESQGKSLCNYLA